MFNHIHHTQTNKTILDNETYNNRVNELRYYRPDLEINIINKEIETRCSQSLIDRLTLIDRCTYDAKAGKPLYWEE